MNLDWISFNIFSYYFSLFKILILILHCHIKQMAYILWKIYISYWSSS